MPSDTARLDKIMQDFSLHGGQVRVQDEGGEWFG